MPAKPRKNSQEQSFIDRARREQIMAACMTVLAEQGYPSASLQRVADQAGISKGLISYYFENRDALMRETLFNGYERLGQEVMSQVDLSAPPPAVLRQLVLVSARVSLKNSAMQHAMTEIISNLRHEDSEKKLNFSDRDATYAGLEQLYRTGQQTGHFRDFDIRAMAVLHQGAIDSMFLYLSSHPETDAEKFAGQIADFLVAAVICSEGQ